MSNAIKYILPQEIIPEAVVHNGVAYLSGQVALNKEGASFTEQVQDVFACTDAALAASGTSKASLLSVTVYLTEEDQYEVFNALYKTWLNGLNKPARTCVKVAFPYQGFLLELSAIAMVPNA
jgi:enamine deaminase RidA (YjgF/YER057c/UK114 family)